MTRPEVEVCVFGWFARAWSATGRSLSATAFRRFFSFLARSSSSRASRFNRFSSSILASFFAARSASCLASSCDTASLEATRLTSSLRRSCRAVPGFPSVDPSKSRSDSATCAICAGVVATHSQDPAVGGGGMGNGPGGTYGSGGSDEPLMSCQGSEKTPRQSKSSPGVVESG